MKRLILLALFVSVWAIFFYAFTSLLLDIASNDNNINNPFGEYILPN